jgi:nitrite transporter NirC
MMMYLGVEGYKRTKNETAKVFIVSFAVVIFILAKFEHSVANMVYFFLAGSFTFKTLLYLIVMILGNAIGAMLLCYMDQKSSEKENVNS